VWAANWPPWSCTFHNGQSGPRRRPEPDLLVFDLDPGADTTVWSACRAAELIRDILDEDGLTGFPKPAFPRGSTVACQCGGAPQRTSEYAQVRRPAARRAHPDRYVAGHGQGAATAGSSSTGARTTQPRHHRPHSLRGPRTPTVSTPVTLAARCSVAASRADLTFTAPDVLADWANMALWPRCTRTPGRLPRLTHISPPAERGCARPDQDLACAPWTP